MNFLKSFCFLFLSMHIFSTINAQNKIISTDFEKLQILEDSISILAGMVVQDSIPNERYNNCKKLIKTLVNSLKIDNSFNYTFSKVKAISIQYPQDSSFRIFTWQLFVDKDTYKYFGAIQMNEPTLKLFPLHDKSEEQTDPEFEVTNSDNWYGALYYNIIPFTNKKTKKYLLFGYDAFSLFNKRKIIDVLYFADGKPMFGAPVFVSGSNSVGHPTEKLKHLIEYSAETSVKLNFDKENNAILFDHLVEINSEINGSPTQIPDGTYEGYKLKDGNWEHVDKMFHLILDKPLSPNPILNKRKGRDLFGRRTKN